MTGCARLSDKILIFVPLWKINFESAVTNALSCSTSNKQKFMTLATTRFGTTWLAKASKSLGVDNWPSRLDVGFLVEFQMQLS
jgi:hypothetical protein